MTGQLVAFTLIVSLGVFTGATQHRIVFGGGVAALVLSLLARERYVASLVESRELGHRVGCSGVAALRSLTTRSRGGSACRPGESAPASAGALLLGPRNGSARDGTHGAWPSSRGLHAPS